MLCSWRQATHPPLETTHLPTNPLELVSCGESLVAGEGGGEGGESAVEGALAFVAGGEAAVAGEPGEGAFALPSVAAEAFGGVDAAAGDAGVMRRSRSQVRRWG